MKILLVNKFHYLKGGSEKYYFELAELLKRHGHEVAFLSMKNEKNINFDEVYFKDELNNKDFKKSKEYFVEQIDLNNGSKLKALDVIYSNANKKKMIEVLDEFKPDIVHLNNFQRQLSASIIGPVKKRNIPIVFTAHDVQAICPAITMLDNNGNICEKCMGGKYTNCIKNKCNKGSTLKSVIGALEGYYYRLNKIYKNKIDYIITPSEFLKSKLVKDGIATDKIIVKNNFIELDEYNLPTEDNGYALYFGRLSKEKGVLNLINAFSKLKNGNLYIAGDGPEKENIEKFIEQNNLQERVKLLGFLNKKQINDAISKCRFVVVPSICYENSPYAVLETLSIGKPVIAANIGGIPELVKNDVCGLTYKYDNTNELAERMKLLFENDELVNKFCKNAKEQALKEYDKEVYYEKINGIYSKLIS